MAHIELRDLYKRFASVAAVSGVSLAVNDGELVALVGPSGCGKTTTLRLIAGFEIPDAGSIELDGQSMLQLPPEARGVGIVFQNYALFPHMNVFENVAYGLKFARSPMNERERVQELLELMGLAELGKRKPNELSAGQQQRVALARALAPSPKILLLDEPLSALDVQLRERLRLEFRKIQRQLKVTTIYVTHDQEEALAISDRVAVMNQGKLEQIGTPWEIYNEPASTFVAGFVGRGNLLEGRVSRVENGRVELQLGDGQTITLVNHSDGSIAVGERVHFLVRPERLRLHEQSENHIRGVVRGIEFLGDAVLLHVGVAELVWRVKIVTPDDALLRSESKDITLGFSPADGKLLPMDSEPDTKIRRNTSIQ